MTLTIQHLSKAKILDIILVETRRLHDLADIDLDVTLNDELGDIHKSQYVAMVNLLKLISAAEHNLASAHKATVEEELSVAS